MVGGGGGGAVSGTNPQLWPSAVTAEKPSLHWHGEGDGDLAV